jgi:FixJ family two-component response regulator
MREVVYIVDEEDSVRSSLDRLLKSFSIDVLSFASVAELLELKPCDDNLCLILDEDTVRRDTDIKGTLDGYCQLAHVIVITTRNEHKAQQLAKDLDAVICLEKPVDAQALMDSIRWSFAQTST